MVRSVTLGHFAGAGIPEPSRSSRYDEQIALRPGDRVIVAPTGLSTASKYMRQILPFLQGVQAIGVAAQGAGSVATQAATLTGN